MGDYEEAERQLEEVRIQASEIPVPKFVAVSVGELGTICHRRGHRTQALKYYDQALTELQQYWQFVRPQFMLQKAALLLEQGDL